MVDAQEDEAEIYCSICGTPLWLGDDYALCLSPGCPAYRMQQAAGKKIVPATEVPEPVPSS